jgi:hypothetical protein
MACTSSRAVSRIGSDNLECMGLIKVVLIHLGTRDGRLCVPKVRPRHHFASLGEYRRAVVP